MTKTPRVPELEDAANKAAAALAQAQANERLAAVNAFLRPVNTLVALDHAPEVSEAAGATFSPLMIVVRHLGGHPALDSGATLAHLTALLGITPEAVNGHLTALAADPRAQNLLKRAHPRGDTELAGVLGGLILARL